MKSEGVNDEKTVKGHMRKTVGVWADGGHVLHDPGSGVRSFQRKISTINSSVFLNEVQKRAHWI